MTAPTVEWLLSQERPTEFLRVDANVELGNMQDYMAQSCISAKFLPVRSIGADIRCLHRNGASYLIWDENYLDHVFRVATTLIADRHQLAWFDPLGRDTLQTLVAELLFSSGHFKASAALIDVVLSLRRHSGMTLADYLRGEYPAEPGQSTHLNHLGIARLYVFFHEVGHLTKRDNPDFYAAIEKEAIATINLYKLLTSGNLAEEDLLSGVRLIQPQMLPPEISNLARDMPRGDISDFALEELSADVLALFLICQMLRNVRPDGLALNEAVFIGGYLFALRLSIEIIRDLRREVSAIASGRPDRSAVSAGSEDDWRTFLLRQCTASNLQVLLLDGLDVSEPGGDPSQGTFWRLNEPFYTLLERRRQLLSPGGTSLVETSWNWIEERMAEPLTTGDDSASGPSRDRCCRQRYLRATGWSRENGVWRHVAS